jgi:diguanylate cyclase (GGDEF)-like protein/putative nucleotidyltransferase with HDIG domain
MTVSSTILVAVIGVVMVLLVCAVWAGIRIHRHAQSLLFDSLTSLRNRRAFDEFVEEHATRRMAVAVIDFDHFTAINDQLGFAEGDRLLCRISSSLATAVTRSCGPAGDVYRVGGDEFLVTMLDTDGAHASASMERVRDDVLGMLEAHEKVMTMTVGIACSPEHARDARHLANYADRALHHAKACGRNRIYTYAPTLFDASDTSRDVLRILADALAAAVDAKDSYTHAHSRNVADLSLYLARTMGCGEELIEEIALGGLLHDIGKIGVSDEVLQKPGKLTNEEWEEIKSHTEIGFEILQGIDGAERIREMVLYHHERPDGTGYPHGLQGTQIPLAARIIGVADAFDSMTADRVYQAGRPPEAALAEIVRLSGKQFDPEVVEALCELMVFDPSQVQIDDVSELPARTRSDDAEPEDTAAAA